MADNLGIAPNRYKDYELGKRIPSADLLIKLVSLFNVNPVWLLTDEGEIIKVKGYIVYRQPGQRKAGVKGRWGGLDGCNLLG